MRHFDFRTLGKLALALATPAALSSGCDSEQAYVRAPLEFGSVGFKLSVPTDLDFEKVEYTITNKAGEVEKNNHVLLAGGGATFIAKIEGVPAGTGHTITLEAQGGARPCSGSTTFDVMAQKTTSVSIRLRCAGSATDTEPGSIMISGDVNVCPAINTAIATPNGNGTYALSASGTDLDGAPAPLSYKWTANVGSIATATSANAMFTCPAQAADVTVVLELSDGDPGCSTVAGVKETLTTVACGAGGAAFQATATAGSASHAAAGDASAAAGGGAGSASVPDRAAVVEWSTECKTCRDQHCRDYAGSGIDLVDGCFTTSSDPTEPNFIQYCVDFLGCAVENQCAYQVNGAYECYCGSANLDECMANGPAADARCMTETHRAAGSSSHQHIMLRFNDLAFPLGWAYFLLDCDKVSCAACTEP